MNIRLLTIVALVIASVSAHAQITVDPGQSWFVRSSVGATSASLDFGADGLTHMRDLGLSCRVLAGHRLTGALDILVGLRYDRVAGHASSPNSLAASNATTFRDSISEFNASYFADVLSLPVMLRISLPVSQFRFGAIGGIAVNSVSRDQDREEYRWRDSVFTQTVDFASDHLTPSLSILGGVETTYQISRTIGLVIDASLQTTVATSRPVIIELRPEGAWSTIRSGPLGFAALSLAAGVEIGL